MKNKIITIPGSKSYTNRALILATLSQPPVTIYNPLFSDDTKAMIDCLRKLGLLLDIQEDKIIVQKNISVIGKGPYNLFAHDSGTTIRFILALLTTVPGTKILQGSEGLNKRPIKELVNGLTQLGAQIEYLQQPDTPPLKIDNMLIKSGTTKLNGDISSQYFSAIMMVAPIVGDITIEVVGNQISKSYIDMTIGMMNDWGVNVINDNYQKYVIKAGQSYRIKEYTVEGDFSGAGYFFGIAALTKSTITLQNLNPNSKQGDLQFVKILEQMGNIVNSGKNEMTIIGKGIKPVVVDMELCPDQAQTLAVLAAFANGVTKMTGVRSLRVKETERVKATQTELAKMGIKTESPNDDTLIIYGGNPRPATIDTYKDHRMAMSFAMAGTMLKDMIINNPEVVNKTFPLFWDKLNSLEIDLAHDK